MTMTFKKFQISALPSRNVANRSEKRPTEINLNILHMMSFPFFTREESTRTLRKILGNLERDHIRKNQTSARKPLSTGRHRFGPTLV